MSLEISADALAELDRSPLVARVSEDTVGKLLIIQSVPRVGAPTVWDAPLNITGTGRTVAVIDTGVSHTHPWLKQNNATIVVTDEACFSVTMECPGGVSSLTAENAAAPCTFATLGCRHGTEVAGIIASRDESYRGVAPGASLLAVNVASRKTGTDCINDVYNDDPCIGIYKSDMLSALSWVYGKRTSYSIASVNISIGYDYYADQGACESLEDDFSAAIKLLRDAGIATVVASGNNELPFAITAPACVSAAVSVGATSGSGTGEGIAIHDDISNCAYGEKVRSWVHETTHHQRPRYYSGTTR